MLFGIPLQVFSALGSFLMSFLASRAKTMAEIEEAKHKRTLELFAAQNEAAVQFMKSEKVKQQDPYFSFTRRILALGVTFGTMVAVFLVPVLFPHVEWIYEIQTRTAGFFGFGARDITELVTVGGIPILFGEVFTHICAIIASFYFGNRLGSVRNPY